MAQLGAPQRSSDVRSARQGAVKERDDVAAKMTPAQIAEAQRLARRVEAV